MSIAGDRVLSLVEAKADLADALALVHELAPPEDLRAALFSAAVQLCTMRARPVSSLPPGGMILDVEHLRRQ